MGSPNNSAGSQPCRTSVSRCARANCWDSSVRTALENPRCSSAWTAYCLADSGEIQRAGQQIGARERTELLFYVPDGIAPWPKQPVGWALDFTVGFLGGRADLRGEIVEQLDLRGLLHQRIGTLSKDSGKRALLAIGLLTRPAGAVDRRALRRPGSPAGARDRRGAAGARLSRADAVSFDSPDQRCGQVLRPVRPAQRRARLRRRHCPATGGEGRDRLRRPGRGIPCPHVAGRRSGGCWRRNAAN